jgi:hypothetical protein
VAKPKRREIFDRVKLATVAIAVLHGPRLSPTKDIPYTIVGSGFCVDSYGLVVTCRHVVDAFMSKPSLQQIAELHQSEKHKPGLQRLGPVDVVVPYALFYRFDHAHHLVVVASRVDNVMAKTDYDLALLRLLPHTAFPNGYPALRVEDARKVGEGDEVATCGFPLGNFLHQQLQSVTSSFTTGVISSIIPSPNVPAEVIRAFQLGITATFGNSGGPVFSLKTGRVFGVLSGGPTDQAGATVAGIAVPNPSTPLQRRRSLQR